MAGVRAVVHGRVQGVWFRGWTRDVACELGLVGWVRNRFDGAVELEAHGERTVLESFVKRLHEGPPLARVSSVETDWSASGPAPDRFEVRYRA